MVGYNDTSVCILVACVAYMQKKSSQNLLK